MKKKQRICDGDHSHSQLRALDAVTFAYPDWRTDFKEAEYHHIKKRLACWFDSQLLSRMKRKQNIQHAGDRSHSQLRALDSVTFNYEGWREDFKNAEHFYIHHQQASFDSILSRMKKKQKLYHDGDRSHSQLRALDAVTFNYEGWQEDFKKAEQHLIMKQSTSFHRILFRMKKTQSLRDGDRSHLQLRALDAVAFDYEGCLA
jgi:hypothetical protein